LVLPRSIISIKNGLERSLRMNGAGGDNPSKDDPDLAAFEQEMTKEVNLQFAYEDASTARTELRQAIKDARAVLSSPRLASIMNIRDKHLAHSLETTRR
jgi:hypothetical protein